MSEKKILILTGSIRSGKTTRLMEWAASQKKIKGITTPLIENVRKFYDLDTKSYFPMLAENEREVIKVGKYIFSKEGFERAEKVIQNGMINSDYLVIDEIGPLELRGEGFNNILNHILSVKKRSFNLILVIRDSMLNEIKIKFNIADATTMNL